MKSFKIIVSVLLILLLFSGCSDASNNLKDLSIVEGMGIDLKDDEIVITVQSLNLSKEGFGAEALSGNITMNSDGSGRNISEAIANITESLSKELFFGQNRLIVFGMDLAKSYLNENLDYLLRSADSRMDVSVCIAEKEAAQIMESKENDALVPSESIASLLELGEKSGFAVDVTTNELLNVYLDKTSDMYLPVISAGEKSASVTGVAIYNDNELVRVLDKNSIYGFLFLSNKISYGVLNVENEQFGKIGLNIISSFTKTRADVENGRVVLHADVKAQLMIDATEKGLINRITRESLYEIKELAEELISSYCQNAFYDSVQSQSDCLRIGESLAMFSPNDYAKLSDDWKNVLPSAVLDLNVNCEFKKINENSKGN